MRRGLMKLGMSIRPLEYFEEEDIFNPGFLCLSGMWAGVWQNRIWAWGWQRGITNEF